MRFKLDENLPSEIVVDLRSAAHDAQSVAEESFGGSPDRPIMECVNRETRVLLTNAP